MITVTLRITEEGAKAVAEEVRPLLTHLSEDEAGSLAYVILEEFIRKSITACRLQDIRRERKARKSDLDQPSIREERG